MATGHESNGKTLWLFSGDATPDVAEVTTGADYAWSSFRWELDNPISNTERSDVLPFERRPMRLAVTKFVVVTAADSATTPGAPTQPLALRVRCDEVRPNNYMSGSGANAIFCDVSQQFLASDAGEIVEMARDSPHYMDVDFSVLNKLTLHLEQRPLEKPGTASPADWEPLTNWQAFWVELRFI